MVRELRQRKSRPNYAALMQGEEENEAGPSKPRQKSKVIEIGSDFEPEKDVEADEDVHMSPGHSSEDHDEAHAIPTRQGKKTTKKRGKSVPSTPGPRQVVSHAGTLPNVHHRHRALPIYNREGKVERFKTRPRLFKPGDIIQTNGWAENNVIADRVGKAWGYNVGPGPLWEMLEDRGWYKEAMSCGDDVEEMLRRPRTHQTVRVQENWCILNEQEAVSYLPTNANVDNENRTISQSVFCSFGPVGRQYRRELKMFDSIKMDEFFPHSTSHVFNCGAPAWGIDWCPIYPEDRAARSYKQYLAVAPLSSPSHTLTIGSKKKRPIPSCIQIWSLSPTTDNPSSEDPGTLTCEMILCIESGCAHELKWCPLPSNDSLQAPDEAKSDTPRKLGILAGTFEDGSLSIFVVPDPEDISRKAGSTQASKPILVFGNPKVHLPEPLLRIELENTACWSFDWGNSEIIAIGCTNGYTAVYDIADALSSGQNGLTGRVFPTHYIPVHQSAIRAISWIRVPTMSGTGKQTADNPTVVATGGYDGMECVTDLREGVGNVLNRTRDVVNSICYSAYCGGPVTIDQENTVKAYSLAPSMLGRGHKLLEGDGPVWSIHASDYHPQLAIGGVDGSCMTTNTLRSTRRGGTVPFFVHKIYQLDYSRNKKEYRMLEHFLPTVGPGREITLPLYVHELIPLVINVQETQDRPSATKANKVLPIGTGAWSPEVGIQRVVWNTGNGLGGAPLLASSTGSGLCRIDWLLGRWMRERIPYYGIEGIRQEVDDRDVMDEDSE